MSTASEEVFHLGEEIANAVTHGLGLLLSIAGLVALVWLATVRGTAWHVVSCAIYGSTLVLLYLSSTLYHALSATRAKKLFRVFDHSAIFLLIAGTYTPFVLVSLRTRFGYALLAVVWVLSVGGVVFKSIKVDGYGAISTGVYVLLGWISIFAVRPLALSLTWAAMGWLVAGGLLYTLGVIFFAWNRRYAHAVWHVFVVGGSVCHYLAVLLYVIPR
ncbi:MAG TPA: hemolysin III family protein [Clostridia bacterium]|nr:hemolysin III family protein [Clostridia bacterium]